MLTLGTGFYYPIYRLYEKTRPWFIISDPHKNDQQIVIVSTTSTFKKELSTCILNRGDHSIITKECEISYRYAMCKPTDWFHAQITSNNLELREKATDDILDAILDGARQTNFLDEELRQILMDQNLI